MTRRSYRRVKRMSIDDEIGGMGPPHALQVERSER